MKNKENNIFNGDLFMERLLEKSHTTSQKNFIVDFARRSNTEPLSESTVSNWNNGAIPKTKTLLLIAKTYNCSIDYLLGIDVNTKEYDILDIIRELMLYYSNIQYGYEGMNRWLDFDYDEGEASIRFHSNIYDLNYLFEDFNNALMSPKLSKEQRKTLIDSAIQKCRIKEL